MASFIEGRVRSALDVDLVRASKATAAVNLATLEYERFRPTSDNTWRCRRFMFTLTMEFFWKDLELSGFQPELVVGRVQMHRRADDGGRELVRSDEIKGKDFAEGQVPGPNIHHRVTSLVSSPALNPGTYDIWFDVKCATFAFFDGIMVQGGRATLSVDGAMQWSRTYVVENWIGNWETGDGHRLILTL